MLPHGTHAWRAVDREGDNVRQHAEKAMRHSVFLVCCVALTLTVWTSPPAWADDTRLGGPAPPPRGVGRRGRGVAPGPSMLPLRGGGGGHRHTYAVAADAVIT